MAEKHKIEEAAKMAVTPGPPQHPGWWIRRNVLDPFGLTIGEAARRIGVRRATLTDMVNKKAALSRDLAYRLEALTGVDADLMINMQAAYDASLAAETREFYAKTIERLQPVEKAA